MNKIWTVLLWFPCFVQARYTEELDLGGREPLPDINLVLYLAGGLAAWGALVWDQGWGARWQPLALAGATALAWAGWGMDGVGAMTFLVFFWAVYAVTRREKPARK